MKFREASSAKRSKAFRTKLQISNTGKPKRYTKTQKVYTHTHTLYSRLQQFSTIKSVVALYIVPKKRPPVAVKIRLNVSSN